MSEDNGSTVRHKFSKFRVIKHSFCHSFTSGNDKICLAYCPPPPPSPLDLAHCLGQTKSSEGSKWCGFFKSVFSQNMMVVNAHSSVVC